jgi:hypothetical protein
LGATAALSVGASKTRTQRSPWVRGPAWDAVFILNAVWLAPLVLWLADGHADPGPLDMFYFGMTALFWIGHRLASAWLAYGTEAYRPLLHAQPVRFVLLPLLVTALCFAIFLPPDTALPWTRLERFIGLAIFDYALSTYHFGAQHFGALSLYRSRTAIGSLARNRDRWFALGVGGVLVFVADALAGTATYQDLWVNRWLPGGFASAVQPIRHGALVLLVLATLAMLLAEARSPERSLPRILYIVGLAGMVTVALQPRSLFPFLVLWTTQHWIVAAGLASRTASREPAPIGGRLRQTLHALNQRPWLLLLFLVLASVFLLPVFEVEASWQDGTHYGDRIFGAFALSLRTSVLVPALLALGFASGFVHYLLDRAVYRLSDPNVRVAATGLVAPQTPSPHPARSLPASPAPGFAGSSRAPRRYRAPGSS